MQNYPPKTAILRDICKSNQYRNNKEKAKENAMNTSTIYFLINNCKNLNRLTVSLWHRPMVYTLYDTVRKRS